MRSRFHSSTVGLEAESDPVTVRLLDRHPAVVVAVHLGLTVTVVGPFAFANDVTVIASGDGLF